MILKDGYGNVYNIPLDNNLNGKRWLVIGDSITAYDGYRNLITDTYGTVTSTGTYVSGGTISFYEIGTDRCIFEKVSSGDWVMAEPDIITIFAGTNDYNNSVPLGTISDDPDAQTSESYTFMGCYKGLIEALNAQYGALVPIILITPTPRATQYTVKNGKTLADFVDAIKEIGRYYACPVVDLYSNGYAPYVGGAENGKSELTKDGDGLHPSEAWSKMLVPHIYEAMNRALSRV